VEVLDIRRKLRIPSSDTNLSTAEGKPLIILSDILVEHIESNMVMQFLHIVTKLLQRCQHPQQDTLARHSMP
jgi:hypothetical protein